MPDSMTLRSARNSRFCLTSRFRSHANGFGQHIILTVSAIRTSMECFWRVCVSSWMRTSFISSSLSDSLFMKIHLKNENGPDLLSVRFTLMPFMVSSGSLNIILNILAACMANLMSRIATPARYIPKSQSESIRVGLPPSATVELTTISGSTDE